jgi:hypothetical protein
MVRAFGHCEMHTVSLNRLPFWSLTFPRALVSESLRDKLAVYITGDGSDVFEDAVFQIAKARTGSFQPILILIGTRLGLDRITPVYWEALKASLQMPQSVGIAGCVRPILELLF